MLIKVDGRCHMTQKLGLDQVVKVKHEFIKEVLINGEIIGGKYNNQIYSSEHILKLLVAPQGTPDIIHDILRGTVGNFTVFYVYDSKISAYTSPGGRGFVYTIKSNTVVISDEESNIYPFLNAKKLNSFDTLEAVLFGWKSPFLTVFENITNIPGGQAVNISNLKVSQHSYLLKSEKEILECHKGDNTTSYYDFKSSLDDTSKLISSKYPNPHLLLSWGIDSSSILLSFLKCGANPHVITGSNTVDESSWGNWDKVYSTNICKKLDISDTQVKFDFTSPQLRDFRDYVYKHVFVTLSNWPASMHIGILYHLIKLENQGVDVLCGEMMDAIYGVHFTKSPFRWSNLKTSLLDTRLRLFYSNIYQYTILNQSKLIENCTIGKYRKKLGSNMMYPSYLEYIYSHMIPDKTMPIPVISDKTLPSELTCSLENYLNYKVGSFCENILGKEKSEGILHGSISGVYLNHIVKTIRYYYYNAVTLNSFYQLEKLENIRYRFPATSGPMLDFLLSFQMSYPHLFAPKRFCYRYFKEVMGYGHDKLKPYSKTNSRVSVSRYKNGIRSESEIQGIDSFKLNNPLFPSNLINDVSTLVNRKHSCVLQYLSDGFVRDYIYSLYKNFETNKVPIPSVLRLYNLEHYLMNL